MTFITERLVMAAGTGLRIVERLDGMDEHKITAVTLGNVVSLEILFPQFDIHPAACMTLQTERLIMTISAVLPCLAGKCAMLAHPVIVLMVLARPVIVVGERNSLFLMAG